MMKLKVVLVAGNGRRQKATITGKMTLFGRNRLARLVRRIAELTPIRRRRLRWLT